MKATLALTLAPEGIILLARAAQGPGWIALDRVSFDDPNLGMGLARLRDKAIATGGPNFTTLLILPNDQLLYTTLPLQDRSPHEAAVSALDGATPYAVSDLSFDTSPAQAPEPAIHVAAVALETLAEAEDFATTHGLRPVAFTAVPEAGRFVGAPHLGQTAASESYLAGAAFEAETDAIFVFDPSEVPSPEVPEATPAADETPITAPPPPEESDVETEVTPVDDQDTVTNAPDIPEIPTPTEPEIGFSSRRRAIETTTEGPSPEARAAAARLSTVAPRFGTAQSPAPIAAPSPP